MSNSEAINITNAFMFWNEDLLSKPLAWLPLAQCGDLTRVLGSHRDPIVVSQAFGLKLIDYLYRKFYELYGG